LGEIAIMRSDHPKPPTHMVSRPSLCVVAQGAKWATFGGERLEYKENEALVVGVATPSVGRVVRASREAPCLVLALELDLAVMREVAEGLDIRPAPQRDSFRGSFVADFTGPLMDCAVRLARLLAQPEAMRMLYPLLMREICYWLLTGEQGREIVSLCLSTSPSGRIMDAVHDLRDRFRGTVRIEELAALAQLSPTAFHRQFKALTSLTPGQYQKQLRLLEARRLMISEGLKAEGAAYRVGYESASQFSREYARMFGAPPRRETARVTETASAELAFAEA
jgi:AraC-like DNA-binding protein